MPVDVENIANQLSIEYVPVLGIHTITEIVTMVKYKLPSDLAIKVYNHKFTKQIHNTVMEGIVARSFPLVLFRKGNPLMFKLKVKDYEKLKESQEKK